MSDPKGMNFDQLTGAQKIAVMLLSVNADTAGQVLSQLDEPSLEEVTREAASLGQVSMHLRHQVVEEFYGLMMAEGWVAEGGLDNVREMLSHHVDPKIAERIMQQIAKQVQKTPFAFLQKAESENLLTFIQDEHPQAIALILSHLPYHKSSDILGRLPTQKQVDVIRRVANMEQTNPEVIREVEAGLEHRLSNMLNQRFEKAGGVESVAEMLNLVDRTTERGILEGLETDDPDLVEEIRRLMFVFEDILLVDDRGIQTVMKEVDNDELALALRTASEDLKTKVFSNMSERAAAMINEDMEFMGPVRISDVEGAQQRIVEIVRRLEDSGEIIISGRGGEKDVVV